MELNVKVKKEAMANLFICAIETPDPVTRGWCGGIYLLSTHVHVAGPWYADAGIYADPALQISVLEIEGDEGSTQHVLTPAKLKAGLERMAADYPRQFVDILTDDADSATADLFLQMACFGEERYA